MGRLEQALGCGCLPVVGPDDGGKYAPVDKVPDDGFHESFSLVQMKSPRGMFRWAGLLTDATMRRVSRGGSADLENYLND